MYNYDAYTKWLASLKVGDTVCYNGSNYNRNYVVAKIDKITPTGRFNVGNIQFNKDGRYRVDTYHSYNLEEYTDKIKNYEEYRKIYQKVLNKMQDLSKLSYIQLKAINEILENV